MVGPWKNREKSINPKVACQSCGASLPVGDLSCRYCKTTYDRDMSRLKYGLESSKTDRSCPDCSKPLQSIDLEIGYKFIIERCPDCLGIFLDKLELEELLAWAKAHPGGVDTPRLLELLSCPERPWEKVVYRDCPVCKEQMSRRNFGKRSGTIIDVCRNHGCWLDAGELNQLIKWSNAGGEEGRCLLNEEKARIKKEVKKTKAANQELNRRRGRISTGFELGSDADTMVDFLAKLFGVD